MKHLIEFKIKYLSFIRNIITKVDNFAMGNNLVFTHTFLLKKFVKYCKLISDEIIKLDNILRKENA